MKRNPETQGFAYQLDCPIDFYGFCMTMEEALKRPHYERMPILEAYGDATMLLSHYTDWEHDTSGGVHVTAIPEDGNPSMEPVIIIKQSNNGGTFIFSRIELPHLRHLQAYPVR